jgi:[ribosomal protein S5]-alanine N-acetyltransferase
VRYRIYLRQPQLTDRRPFLEVARRSRVLHQPWIVAPSSATEFRSYVKQMALPANRAFLVCRKDSHEIAGVINITNIVLGLFRSGYLSYYAFVGHDRQGLMLEGLQTVIRVAFGSLKLHRLEANIQPGNVASVALVRACGFSKEGYSARYLKIGGRWRDHERWAILASPPCDNLTVGWSGRAARFRSTMEGTR